MPFTVKLFILASLSLRFMRLHLKLLDQEGNLGIYEPFLAYLIQPIFYDERE